MEVFLPFAATCKLIDEPCNSLENPASIYPCKERLLIHLPVVQVCPLL